MAKTPKEMKAGLEKLKDEIVQKLEEIDATIDDGGAVQEPQSQAPAEPAPSGQEEKQTETPAKVEQAASASEPSEPTPSEPEKQTEAPPKPADDMPSVVAEAQAVDLAPVGENLDAGAAFDDSPAASPPPSLGTRPLIEALLSLEEETEQHPQGMAGALSYIPHRKLPADAAMNLEDGIYGVRDSRWQFTVVNGVVVSAVRSDLVHFVVDAANKIVVAR